MMCLVGVAPEIVLFMLAIRNGIGLNVLYVGCGLALVLAIIGLIVYIDKSKERARKRAAAQLPTPIAPGSAVVTEINHITTVLDPEDARRLSNILTHNLKLNRVWEFRDFGDFQSGGWRIGNVNFEVIGLDPSNNKMTGMPKRFISLVPTSLTGIGTELARRGLKCSKPYPQNDNKGHRLYTRVELLNMSEEFVVQLCAYPLRTSNPEAGARFNPAGLQHVETVCIGARDIEMARLRWSALLAPIKNSQDVYEPEVGPAIRLEPSSEDDITGIIIQVRDAYTAREELKKAGLAVSTDGSVMFGSIPARLVNAPATVSAAALSKTISASLGNSAH